MKICCSVASQISDKGFSFKPQTCPTQAGFKDKLFNIPSIMKTNLFFLFVICIYSFGFSQTTTIQYTPITGDIPNPERGFYTPTITFASNYTPLNASYVAGLRNAHTPFAANYTVQSTLVHRYFVLDNFVNSPIDASFLANMQSDFDAARQAGVKLIIRYSYTNTPPTGSCGNWICPPYGDADKATILGHITQLESFWEANKDIIAVVQMGFIGVWGENYYTDHFGDASLSPFIITNANWQDRNDILNALINAVPEERMVQVRYPQLKQRLVYGIGAPTSVAALTSAEAYTETAKARIGFHNDCYLASDTDFGTYSDYGPPVASSDTSNLKPYVAADTQFVPMGGETCSANNPDDDCAMMGGRADTEMRRMHYSYLNSEYNNVAVNNNWVGSCIEDIKAQLGYRFSLVNGTYPNTIDAGASFDITIHLENNGYAAPFNKRGLELVFRNSSSGVSHFAPLDHDPRLWLPGTHIIQQTLCTPPNLPNGTYDLLLNLPDPSPTLFDNPLYSIQLANNNVWESTTGYNDLNHSVMINAPISNPCTGTLTMSSVSVYDPAYCTPVLNVADPILNDLYIAKTQILSDGAINAGIYPVFRSGHAIDLNANFEVKLGAEFWAFIQGCYE